MQNFFQDVQKAIGEKYCLIDEADKIPFQTEGRDRLNGKALAVLLPANTQEVSDVVKICNKHNISFVPQSGNTGLVAGQMPDKTGTQVVISLKRLRTIREIDDISGTLTLDSGLTLLETQKIAQDAGWMFPISLGSEGSCTVGGTISTNAGGTGVIAYGMMRAQVLGLEVVLNDGRIWNGLKKLKKDNFGLDLKQLFIGAEGAHGLITAASLALQSRPASTSVSFIAVESPLKSLELLTHVQKSGVARLTAFELIPHIGVQMCVQYEQGMRNPFAQDYPWYVLLEMVGGRHGLDEDTDFLLMDAIEKGLALDAVRTQSLEQADMLWDMRHRQSEVQKHAGGSIKHDVSTPVTQIHHFIEEATQAASSVYPNCRPFAFGHVGDGNIHFDVLQPEGEDKAKFMACWDDMNEAVHAVALKYNGSVAAEHGVGRLKAPLLKRLKSEVELEMLSRIHAALAFS